MIFPVEFAEKVSNRVDFSIWSNLDLPNVSNACGIEDMTPVYQMTTLNITRSHALTHGCNVVSLIRHDSSFTSSQNEDTVYLK